MKYFSVLLIAILALVGVAQAIYCPCDLTKKQPICGSNNINYKNQCEFECTQREYRKLGRLLNIKKEGPC